MVSGGRGGERPAIALYTMKSKDNISHICLTAPFGCRKHPSLSFASDFSWYSRMFFSSCSLLAASSSARISRIPDVERRNEVSETPNMYIYIYIYI
jgi:hypothetical protein